MFQNVDSLEAVIQYSGATGDQVAADVVLPRAAERLLIPGCESKLLSDFVHAGLKVSNISCDSKIIWALKVEEVKFYLIADFLSAELFDGQLTLVNIVGEYLPWWNNLEEMKRNGKLK